VYQGFLQYVAIVLCVYDAFPACRSSTPSVDRTLKPAHFTHTDTDLASTNKYGLKTVKVPLSLASSFAAAAQTNTRRNVETCGLLCGKLVRKPATNSSLLYDALKDNLKLSVFTDISLR